MKLKVIANDNVFSINDLGHFIEKIPGWCILENRCDNWILRSNCIDLSSNNSLFNELANYLANSFELADDSTLAIDFSNIGNISSFDDFSIQNGLEVSKKYLKILFLSNVSSENGLPMLKVASNLGAQRVAQHLRITLPCDAVVYDANLDKFNLGENQEIFGVKWDMVSHGYMAHVLHNDIEYLDVLYRQNPNALFVVGGPEISKNSTQANMQLFESIPYDIGIEGPAFDAMQLIAQKIIDGNGLSKEAIFGKNRVGANTFVFDDGELLYGDKTFDHTSFNESLLPSAYEPIIGSDIFHKTTYKEMNSVINMGGRPLDFIGSNPLGLLISNICNANCVFCGSKNFNTSDFSVNEAFQYLQEELMVPNNYDYLLFRDNDLFNTPQKSIKILAGLERLQNETGLNLPVKAQAKAKSITNLLKEDARILNTFHQRGFRVISLGIESFHVPSLDFFGNKATVDENRLAIEALTDAGIRVGMYMILASPVDTISSIISSIEETMQYLQNRNVFVQVASKIQLASSSLLETSDKLRNKIREKHHSFVTEEIQSDFMKQSLIRESTVGLHPEVADLYEKIQGGCLLRLQLNSLFYEIYYEFKDKYGLNSVNQFSVNLTAIVYLITFIKGVKIYYPQYLPGDRTDMFLENLYSIFDNMFQQEHAHDI